MNDGMLWLAGVNGLIAGLAFTWGLRVGRRQNLWLTKAQKRDVWNQGHEEGFWNGRLSHGDPQALTGVAHAKATNPYRKSN